MDDTTQTRVKPRRSRLLLAIVAGLVGTLVGAGAVYAIDHRPGSSTPGGAESPIPPLATLTAVVMRCENALDAKLQTPTRARYYDIDARKEAGNAGWWIEGHADVTNASGGYNVRTWRCYYLDDQADADLTDLPSSPAPTPTSTPT